MARMTEGPTVRPVASSRHLRPDGFPAWTIAITMHGYPDPRRDRARVMVYTPDGIRADEIGSFTDGIAAAVAALARG